MYRFDWIPAAYRKYPDDFPCAHTKLYPQRRHHPQHRSNQNAPVLHDRSRDNILVLANFADLHRVSCRSTVRVDPILGVDRLHLYELLAQFAVRTGWVEKRRFLGVNTHMETHDHRIHRSRIGCLVGCVRL